MARRALEIGSLVASATAQGVPTALATFTVRHHRGTALAASWGAVSHGWQRATSGKHWIAERDRAGLLGYCRVQEVTYGENGWHPHVHALLFGSGLTDDQALEDLCGPMWARWARAVQRKGLDAPLPVASEWHRIEHGHLAGTALGEYLTVAKTFGARPDTAAAIGMELTQTQSKVARAVHGTHSVWELLDGANNGEVSPLGRWREWEEVSKGRRQIAYSRGLRELFGLTLPEQSDEDIAAEELGSDDDTVVVILPEGWAVLVAFPPLIPELLEVVENLGTAALCEWLSDKRIAHERV
jgi:hypothetical protein